MNNSNAMWFDDFISSDEEDVQVYYFERRPMKQRLGKAPSDKFDTKRYRQDLMPRKKSRRRRERDLQFL